jgi:hypothetical protein
MVGGLKEGKIDQIHTGKGAFLGGVKRGLLAGQKQPILGGGEGGEGGVAGI